MRKANTVKWEVYDTYSDEVLSTHSSEAEAIDSAGEAEYDRWLKGNLPHIKVRKVGEANDRKKQ